MLKEEGKASLLQADHWTLMIDLVELLEPIAEFKKVKNHFPYYNLQNGHKTLQASENGDFELSGRIWLDLEAVKREVQMEMRNGGWTKSTIMAANTFLDNFKLHFSQ